MLQSLNGTYVNKKKINAGILHTLNVGDEVGIGVDLEAAHIVNNKCSIFRVQKSNNLEVITLDDSDEEEITNQEPPIVQQGKLNVDMKIKCYLNGNILQIKQFPILLKQQIENNQVNNQNK